MSRQLGNTSIGLSKARQAPPQFNPLTDIDEDITAWMRESEEQRQEAVAASWDEFDHMERGVGLVEERSCF